MAAASLGCGGFRAVIFKIRDREGQCLADIPGLRFRIVAEQLLAFRINRHRVDHTAYCQKHSANAGLSVHLIWVPGDAFESCHGCILADCQNARSMNTSARL
jgi:hypothetical protein